jgi:hypothetical protein
MLPGYPEQQPWEPDRRSTQPAGARPTLLLVAWVCGALPLVAGISVFALWLVTRQTAFQLLGVGVLALGPPLFLIGAFALAAHAIGMLGVARPRAGLTAGVCRFVVRSKLPAAAAQQFGVGPIEKR